MRRSIRGKGAFEATAIRVKEVGSIKIVFYSKEAIYVQSKEGVWVVFHRYGAGKGSYNGGWRQFRHLLFYEKTLDFAHCHRLAFRFDIQSQVSRSPNLEGKAVEIITIKKEVKNEME